MHRRSSRSMRVTFSFRCGSHTPHGNAAGYSRVRGCHPKVRDIPVARPWGSPSNSIPVEPTEKTAPMAEAPVIRPRLRATPSRPDATPFGIRRHIRHAGRFVGSLEQRIPVAKAAGIVWPGFAIGGPPTERQVSGSNRSGRNDDNGVERPSPDAGATFTAEPVVGRNKDSPKVPGSSFGRRSFAERSF